MVLSAGNIALTPRFTGVDVANKTFTGFDMGLLDRTGNYADQKWYAATDAVLHVSNAELDAASGLWQTPSSVADVAGYTTGPNARLMLGLDTAAKIGGMNSPFTDAISGLPQGNMTLTEVTTPPGGRVRVYPTTGSLNSPSWDSQALATGQAQKALTAPKARNDIYDGWAFDKAGIYCLTASQVFAQGIKPYPTVTEQATYTVVVGDLPSSITMCPQPSGTPGGGSNPGGPAPVTRMTTGHLDVRSWLNDAGTGLNFGIYAANSLGISQYTSTNDLVLGGTNQGTIPAPNDVSNLTFIAPVGSTYYYFSQAVQDPNTELWPGFSGENWKRSDLAINQAPSTTLTGITGPAGGQAILFADPASQNNGNSDPSSVYFNSAWGTPWTRTDNNLGHTHMNWAFTQPGRYCLAFSTKAPLADGRTVTGGGQLTVWVGDVSGISAVNPCDRDTTPAVTNTWPAPTETAVTTPVVSSQGLDEIQPYLDGQGALRAPVQTRPQTTSTATYYDVNNVIFSTERKITSSSYILGGGQSPDLRVRSDRISPSSLDGPITVTMGAVQGPGSISAVSYPGTTLFDSAPGPGQSLSYTQPAQSFQELSLVASKAGVYCVPLTWSVTPKGASAPVTVSRTLTLVAGSGVAGAADYIDRSTLTTCGRGQQAMAPGGGGGGSGTGPVTDAQVFVPNESLTDSGAVILNNGHVDVASKINGSTLETWVKDTTESSTPRYHPLTGSASMTSSDRNASNNGNGTVFQILPGAQSSVPAGNSYAFLGTAGAPLWQVSQTQQDGLLWPGWSTEEIPLSATQTGVQWTLDKIQGPGEFALYETQLSSVSVLLNTRDGITAADSILIPKNAHVHASWAFSAEGTYCLGFTRSTTLANGTPASDHFTLAVAVGRVDVKKVDPGACFTSQGKPATQDITPIPDAQLTAATSGGVQVLDAQAGFYPGQQVTTQLGASHAGQWVSAWLDSTSWLGWAQVGTSGAIQVRLPADAALGSHKLVVKTQAGDLIGWDVLATVKPPDSGNQNPPPGGDQNPPPGGGQNPAGCAITTTIIDHGHLDYSTQVIGGKLTSLIGDDSSGSRVYRKPGETILWLKPSSKTTLQSGYEQVGPAGSSVYIGPQTQSPDLIWLGWSTELVNASMLSSPVTWTIDQVTGPGRMSVFLQGPFGGIQQMVFDNGGSYQVNLGVHAHANWTFSAEGIYRLHMTQSATLANGQQSSDSQVLTIAVGNVDPASAAPGGAGCVTTVPGGGLTVADPGAGSIQNAVQQGADAARCTPKQSVVISAGHLDWNSQIVGGKLASLIGDDSTGTRVYRDPGSTVLWLKPASRVNLPAGFSQVGSPGTTVWQVPQTQDMNLIWLGWSTEALNAGNTSSPVTWTLNSVDGPGTVTVYTTGSFGGVQDVVFSGPGSYRINQGVHAHANWAFSKEGVYRLNFTQTVTLAGGTQSSDTKTLTIAVGNVDPTTVATDTTGCGVVSNAMLQGADPLAAARAADQQLQAMAAQAAAGVLPGQDAGSGSANPISTPGTNHLVPLLLYVLGGLLLVGSAGSGLLWWRRKAWGTTDAQAPAAVS